jgi:hypothetical protein
LEPVLSHIPESLAAELNAAAVFLPQDPTEEGSLPVLENGGVQIYAYWTPTGLDVSLHFDDLPDALRDTDGNVPVRIDVADHTVYVAA